MRTYHLLATGQEPRLRYSHADYVWSGDLKIDSVGFHTKPPELGWTHKGNGKNKTVAADVDTSEEQPIFSVCFSRRNIG